MVPPPPPPPSAKKPAQSPRSVRVRDAIRSIDRKLQFLAPLLGSYYTAKPPKKRQQEAEEEDDFGDPDDPLAPHQGHPFRRDDEGPEEYYRSAHSPTPQQSMPGAQAAFSQPARPLPPPRPARQRQVREEKVGESVLSVVEKMAERAQMQVERLEIEEKARELRLAQEAREREALRDEATAACSEVLELCVASAAGMVEEKRRALLRRPRAALKRITRMIGVMRAVSSTFNVVKKVGAPVPAAPAAAAAEKREKESTSGAAGAAGSLGPDRLTAAAATATAAPERPRSAMTPRVSVPNRRVSLDVRPTGSSFPELAAALAVLKKTRRRSLMSREELGGDASLLAPVRPGKDQDAKSRADMTRAALANLPSLDTTVSVPYEVFSVILDSPLSDEGKLPLQLGQRVVAYRRSAQGWLFGHRIGVIGNIPGSYVQLSGVVEGSEHLPRYATALYDFEDLDDATVLPIAEGDQLVMFDYENLEGWCIGAKAEPLVGHFHSSFVQPLQVTISAGETQQAQAQAQAQQPKEAAKASKSTSNLLRPTAASSGRAALQRTTSKVIKANSVLNVVKRAAAPSPRDPSASAAGKKPGLTRSATGPPGAATSTTSSGNLPRVASRTASTGQLARTTSATAVGSRAKEISAIPRDGKEVPVAAPYVVGAVIASPAGCLPLKEGDRALVLRKSEASGWMHCAALGPAGNVPAAYVALDELDDAALELAKAAGARLATALYDYADADDPAILAVAEKDRVVVYDWSDPDGWYSASKLLAEGAVHAKACGPAAQVRRPGSASDKASSANRSTVARLAAAPRDQAEIDALSAARPPALFRIVANLAEVPGCLPLKVGDRAVVLRGGAAPGWVICGQLTAPGNIPASYVTLDDLNEAELAQATAAGARLGTSLYDYSDPDDPAVLTVSEKDRLVVHDWLDAEGWFVASRVTAEGLAHTDALAPPGSTERPPSSSSPRPGSSMGMAPTATSRPVSALAQRPEPVVNGEEVKDKVKVTEEETVKEETPVQPPPPVAADVVVAAPVETPDPSPPEASAPPAEAEVKVEAKVEAKVEIQVEVAATNPAATTPAPAPFVPYLGCFSESSRVEGGLELAVGDRVVVLAGPSPPHGWLSIGSLGAAGNIPASYVALDAVDGDASGLRLATALYDYADADDATILAVSEKDRLAVLDWSDAEGWFSACKVLAEGPAAGVDPVAEPPVSPRKPSSLPSSARRRDILGVIAASPRDPDEVLEPASPAYLVNAVVASPEGSLPLKPGDRAVVLRKSAAGSGWLHVGALGATGNIPASYVALDELDEAGLALAVGSGVRLATALYDYADANDATILAVAEKDRLAVLDWSDAEGWFSACKVLAEGPAHSKAVENPDDIPDDIPSRPGSALSGQLSRPTSAAAARRPSSAEAGWLALKRSTRSASIARVVFSVKPKVAELPPLPAMDATARSKAFEIASKASLFATKARRSSFADAVPSHLELSRSPSPEPAPAPPAEQAEAGKPAEVDQKDKKEEAGEAPAAEPPKPSSPVRPGSASSVAPPGPMSSADRYKEDLKNAKLSQLPPHLRAGLASASPSHQAAAAAAASGSGSSPSQPRRPQSAAAQRAQAETAYAHVASMEVRAAPKEAVDSIPYKLLSCFMEYRAGDSSELSIGVGDRLVAVRANATWMYGFKMSKIANAPSNFLSLVPSRGKNLPAYASALYTHKEGEDDTLDFEAGQLLVVLSKPTQDGWWIASHVKETGHFPRTFVQELKLEL